MRLPTSVLTGLDVEQPISGREPGCRFHMSDIYGRLHLSLAGCRRYVCDNNVYIIYQRFS